ncbi:MAG TPA: hypothetical protein VGY97_07035, partial [Solirubrobacteraceae bacterium]|nr:hypothetical protein [Solirubrobacteraceae bacterium]
MGSAKSQSRIVPEPELARSATGAELPRAYRSGEAAGAGWRPFAARSSARGVLDRVLDGTALLALGLLVGAVAYLAAAAAAGRYAVDTSGAHEPNWVAGPLRDIASPLTPDGFGVAILVMLGAYLVVLVRARSVSPRYVIAAIVAAHVAIALAPPLLSADVFGYIAFARLGTVHHLNPYLHAPIETRDVILPFIFWRHAKSPYGPLFTLATYPLVSLGPQGTLWALKGLAAAASLGVVALVWRGAAQRGFSPVAAAVLVGLNPFTIVYAVGGAHNDLYWLALLTAAAVALGAQASSGADGQRR